MGVVRVAYTGLGRGSKLCHSDTKNTGRQPFALSGDCGIGARWSVGMIASEILLTGIENMTERESAHPASSTSVETPFVESPPVTTTANTNANTSRQGDGIESVSG